MIQAPHPRPTAHFGVRSAPRRVQVVDRRGGGVNGEEEEEEKERERASHFCIEGVA